MAMDRIGRMEVRKRNGVSPVEIFAKDRKVVAGLGKSTAHIEDADNSRFLRHKGNDSDEMRGEDARTRHVQRGKVKYKTIQTGGQGRQENTMTCT
jgi:hypothetical protein